MKKYIVLVVIFLACFKAESAIIPSGTFASTIVVPTEPVHPVLNLSTAKIKDIEKLLGRKMKLKEKIAFKVYQWQLKKGLILKKEEVKKDKGKTAMILGIIGLASPLIPIIGGISFIVCTVLALVLGYQAKKENPENRKAKTAIILGWIGVGLFVVAAILLIAFIVSLGIR